MSAKDHHELRVYQLAFQSAIQIHQLTKSFPSEERYSLTDQIRRSSRSICANIAEAWRKRCYPKNFVSKLSDADSEAAETLVWLILQCTLDIFPSRSTMSWLIVTTTSVASLH